MAFGLSDEGFDTPRTADFLTLIRDEYVQRTELAIDWARDTFLGQITAIMAARLGELADAVQAAYDATDPNNATGAQLDNLALIVGINRKPATFAQATVVLSGVAGTHITAGRIVQGGTDPATRWALDDDSTIVSTVLVTDDIGFTAGGTLPARIARTTGSWITDGIGVGTILTVAGSVSNNKDVTVTAIVSSSIIEVRESLITEGPVSATVTGGFATVVAVATERGFNPAAALAINTIATPVFGWQAVSNPVVASSGSDIETDEALRDRRDTALAVSGSASALAIRSNLLELTFLTAAVVLENDTMLSAVVGGKTLPAKSFGAVVYPNTLTTAQQETVARTIYDAAPAGIEIVGTDVIASIDGFDGYSKAIGFDYATPLTVNVATTVSLASGYTLALVSGTIQDLISTYFAQLTVGQPVRLLELSALVATVAGVNGATFTLNAGSVDIEPVLSEVATLGTNTVS